LQVAPAADAPVAAPPAPAAAAQPAVFDVTACRRLALEHQPAVAAAQDSFTAAVARAQAIERLRVPTLDIHIRRQQSPLGVEIAQAGVRLAEAEAIYAATRNYLSAVYAQQQLDLIDRTIPRLKELRAAIHQAEETHRNVAAHHTMKADLYLQLAESRRKEAVFGLQRALAALREAMGVGPDFCLVLADRQLPSLHAALCREELRNLALARRSEMAQAALAAEVFGLEVKAQGMTILPTARTFASASDIHAQQVPQGERNDVYRPGALPLEMPPNLAGGKAGRVEQAKALHAKALAVVDKTRNLIALEIDDNYFKAEEYAGKLADLEPAAKSAEEYLQRVRDEFKPGNAATSPDDVLNAGVLATQTRAQANDALYHYLLALAGLERATAGGFCAGFEAGPPRP
jgi:outer membrane protein TolC